MAAIDWEHDEHDDELTSYTPLAWLILSPFVALLWAWVVHTLFA